MKKKIEQMENMNRTYLFSILLAFANIANAQNNPITFDPGGGAGGDKFGIKATESGNNTTKFHIYRNFTIDDNDIDRFVIDTGGKIGIGTSIPDARLHVFGSNVGDGNPLASIMIGQANGVELQSIQEGNDTDVQSLAFRVKKSATHANPNFEAMRIRYNGNVGIGITQPLSKFDIAGAGDGAELLRLSTERPWVFRQTNTGSYSELDLHSTVNGKNFKITSLNNFRTAQFHVSGVAEDNKVFLVPDGGKVGIGTTSMGSHRLAVDGSIGAREVKVEASGWSDYVFDDDYELRPLEEVEKFIKKNKHLPDIPSETEVLENGINLGEMDAKLLRKIEELTLYQIELLTRLDSQQKEIDVLRARLN